MSRAHPYLCTLFVLSWEQVPAQTPRYSCVMRLSVRHTDIAHAGFPSAACSMGNSTSRLYSALAKTLSSSAVSQHQDCLEQPNSAQLEPIDPKDLLEECQLVLQKRPPRFQRNFVDLKKNTASNHRPIRVMQWNILAQGRSSGWNLETKCSKKF